MMRSRFVAARFHFFEDEFNMRQLHLRYGNGRCEAISLFGARVQAVRAPENPDDTQPSFAENSICFSPASAAEEPRAFACPTAASQARLFDALCAAGCIMPDMVAQLRIMATPADLPWFVRRAEAIGARMQTRDSGLAVKVATDADKKKQLLNEMKFLLPINHDAILRVYGMYDVKSAGEPSLGLISDFKEGGHLTRWIPKDGMSEGRAKGVFSQVCSALKYLHDRRIVHRDIKPSNVFCEQAVDGSLKATLADFGFAMRADDVENMSSSCGTAGYIAPEVLRMDWAAQCSKRFLESRHGYENWIAELLKTDVFSAGMLLYVMATGTNDFIVDDVEETYRNNQRGQINLSSRLQHLSHQLKTFICLLCEDVPRKRVSIFDTFSNPWLH
jgi:serine/threonine protein kinase